MILLEIPLVTSVTDQTLNVTLDNVPYTLRVLWNERFQYFALSINERDGDVILDNIKMVNNYPLVKRFQKLVMKGDLYLLHKGGKTVRPTFESLGTDYGLYYYDAETPIVYPTPIKPVV